MEVRPKQTGDADVEEVTSHNNSTARDSNALKHFVFVSEGLLILTVTNISTICIYHMQNEVKHFTKIRNACSHSKYLVQWKKAMRQDVLALSQYKHKSLKRWQDLKTYTT